MSSIQPQTAKNIYQLPRYMVIERFHTNKLDEIYQRFTAHGRMLPDELHYLDSWLSKDKNICFQLMATNHEALFQDWFKHWQDLTDFEVYPINQTPENPASKEKST